MQPVMEKSSDRWGLQNIFFKKKCGIRKQVQHLIFVCCIVSFLTVSVIALAGMFTARQNSIADGSQMGERAAEISADQLEDAEQRRISLFAREEAEGIGIQLKRTEDLVRLLSGRMTYILAHPEDYMPQSIAFPRAEHAGTVTAQLELAPDADYDELKDAIGLAANVADMMVFMSEGFGEGTAVALGDERGFYFTADTESDKHLTAEGRPMPFDPRTRPWYQKAQAAGDLVYADMYSDQYSGALRIACAMPYKRNNEFGGVVVISSYLSLITEADVPAETDTCFIIDGQGRLLFLKDGAGIFPGIAVGQSNLLETEQAGLAETIAAMVGKEEGIRSVSFDGKDYYVAFSPIPEVGWSFAAVLDAGEIVATKESARQDVLAIAKKNVEGMDRFITRLILVMIVAILIAAWALRRMGYGLGGRFAEPILELSDGVREIASGNLDKKLDIATGDEIEHLANCFNAMTDELKAYIENLARATAEKERAAAELSIARDIQIGALPQDFLAGHGEFQIYATMDAAKGVGGDFYDFYMRDENHLVVTIADVSGKGVPAALYMMRAKTTLKNLALMAGGADDFGHVMELANRELCRENEAAMFVTVFFAQLDLATGELVYVDGGHNLPLVRKEGKFRYLVQKKKHLILGVEEDATYKAYRLALRPDDMLFLYTDGVTEAMDKDGNLYTEERLEATLNRIDGSLSVQEILAEVRKDIDAHADGAEQSDDITMLGLRFLGKG